VIERARHLRALGRLVKGHPAVGILGARQVGKTTLAQEFSARYEGPTTRFDLEDPDDLARLAEPKLALEDLDGLIILDEIQRRPDLFPVLRVLIDRPAQEARFLILGSASPDLLRQSSETLAGRIIYHDLGGLSVEEVGQGEAQRLWLRGGFPRSYLSTSERESFEWRRAFVRSFLERDIPQLGVQIPSATLHRFWRMLAHYHGQLWNGAELARAFGVTEPTVRRYLDVLTGALVLHQLPPWWENIKKRQVRSPKVYLSDSGLLHTLLGIQSREDLESHPKIGASWEGFVIDEIAMRLGARPEECFFWATYAGAELDLLIVRGVRRRAFEVKRTTAPRTTRSMRAAMESLGLERLDVVHAGEETYPLARGIRALAFSRLEEDLEPLEQRRSDRP
jgi:predicted AAA+ superfamily ATPase